MPVKYCKRFINQPEHSLDDILKNKVIVITRDKTQAIESIKQLEALGAIVIPFPTIKIEPMDDYNEFDYFANRLSSFDYLIFTSANAVKYTVQRLNDLGIIIPIDILIAAVGKKTAYECSKNKITVIITPRDYSASGLIEHFRRKDISGKFFFIPCSSIARDELSNGLGELGGIVKKTPVYNVTTPSMQELQPNFHMLNQQKPDLFIFTSPSTFENYITINNIEAPEKYFSSYTVAAIGTVTEKNIKSYNVNVDIVPEEFTMETLIEEIKKFYKEN